MQHSPNKLSTFLQIFFSRLIPEVDSVHEGDDVVSGLIGAVPHKVVISRESGHFSMHTFHIFFSLFSLIFQQCPGKEDLVGNPKDTNPPSENITIIL
jgi:hypothetical protein